MALGTVKPWNTIQGLGSITADGGDKDLIVRTTQFNRTGFQTVKIGQRVSFDVGADGSLVT